MIRFVHMTPELFGLLPVAAEFAEPSATGHVTMCLAPNIAVAMLDGGRVIAAAGVVQVWPGRGYAWFLPGTWMERRHFGRALARCRREMGRLEEAGYRRIECVTRAGHPARARFVQRLGFAAEGTMRRFGVDGADHVLWARVS